MKYFEKILDWIGEVGFPIFILYLIWKYQGFEAMVFMGFIFVLMRTTQQKHISGGNQ
jgi:hypothetical protein